MIEHQVNHVYRTCTPGLVNIDEPGLANINLNVELLTNALVFTSDLQTGRENLHFNLERSDPVIMMFFQLKGAGHFLYPLSFVVPEMHHSINHVPMFQSAYSAKKNTFSKSVCVKISPQKLLEEWPCASFHEDWFRSLQEQKPFVTLHESRPMNGAIMQHVLQLVNCPYKGKMGESYQESIITLLLIEQLAAFAPEQRLSPTDEVKKLTRSDIDVLHDVKAYLDKNYLDDLSLEKLARRFGINSFKLKYGFRKLFNTTVMRFIDDKKMQYAGRLLLEQQNLDRFDLADRLGYNHYSNFSTAFKKHFGQSPAMYKKYFSHNS